MALTIRTVERTLEAFADILERLRYRRGFAATMPPVSTIFNRLLGDNRRLGILCDVTRELGGRPLLETGALHDGPPGSYPPLADGLLKAEIRRAETQSIEARGIIISEGAAIAKAESLIREGDVIGVITAAAKGLDVVHLRPCRQKGKAVSIFARLAPGGRRRVLRRKPCTATSPAADDTTGIVVGRLAVARVRRQCLRTDHGRVRDAIGEPGLWESLSCSTSTVNKGGREKPRLQV
jgi:hypothetical protein